MDHLRTGHPSLPKPWLHRLAALVLGLTLLGWPNLRADAVDDATKKLRAGDYAGAAADAAQAIKDTYATEALVRVEGEALLDEGHYNEAYAVLKSGLDNSNQSTRLRLLLYQACLYTDKPTEAQQMLGQINEIINNLINLQQYTQTPLPAQTLADAGEAALLQHVDPKTILESYLNLAQKATPPVRDAFLAAGRLELDKHDFDLASRSFAAGLDAFPDDADMLAGLAASYRDSDREKFATYAQKALDANPRHVPTLLLLANNLIDAETFDKAGDALDKILAINPNEPEALALKAVVAYLHTPPDQAATTAEAYRAKALSTWKNNPRVDYLIGQKLSQNYRFTLGAKYQRLALASDPAFTPARVQLAQDLLRLGQEDEGWQMAAQANKEDAYDVEAFNLVTLHDEISNYTVISSNPHFTLVMEPQEAKVYGARALALLERARDTLTKKYGLDLNFPVLVEIFPNAADFSVRTFGMPDIGEFLGVTFGPVVTINAPSDHESSWEDVLWHEFTHVVTLTTTHNQMPRWLSEGISVYEETQGSPNWGEHMSPMARERIRTGKMQPISSMSAAFLQAKSAEDTEFAYYESSLVVQFLISHYGFDHLTALLHSLGDGMLMDDALAKNFAPLTQLDEQFAQYANDLAAKYAPAWDFTPPHADADTLAALATLLPTDAANKITEAAATPPPAPTASSNNFYARMTQIQDLVGQQDWAKARDQLKTITSGDFYLPGPDNPYLVLAKVCNKLNDAEGEKAALLTVAAHEGDSLAAASRLLEIAQAEKNWADVIKWADATLAIHPMMASAWRALLDAHEQRNENAPGIEAGLALLALDPPDLALVNYRVAKMMQPTNTEGARRHVLMALEEAPRFRAAFDLLATLPPAPANPSTPATP
jgi:predicted Zn-dependent protease